jgi:hypothetical protein
MISTNNPTKKERIFQRLLGLNFNEFEILLKNIEKIYKNDINENYGKNDRYRRPGGGRKSKIIGVRGKLIITLIYFKLYMSQEVLGVFFGIDQSNVSRIISLMLKFIEQAADPKMNKYLEEAKKDAPVGNRHISNMADFLRKYPELEEIATDCTESPCQRPKEKSENKKYYSGKKKRHTEKTQITVSSSGKILEVSKSYPGSVHDKTILDQEKTIDRTTCYSRHFMDKGYCGANKEHKDKNILIPFKRPKGGKLTDFQKEVNSYIGSKRIFVEHIIGKLKNYHIISDIYRGPKECFNQVFVGIAALWNFKLQVSYA